MAAVFAAAALASSASASGPSRLWLGFLDDAALRWAPDRAAAWDDVRASHASVVRTIVRWDQIARTRPANAMDSFDPAYNFNDLDDFVIAAQRRGVEVLLTLWGTPAWANGGAAPNVPPVDTSDFRAFAFAVAQRYSGAYAGLPFARFFSIWNEPNTRGFLRAANPPAAYAALVEAGYGGIKSASPAATVAAGETAARHAPAAFVDALARLDPKLPFDAWAHHPYPARPGLAPDARQPWPDVGLPELGRFGGELDRVFNRPGIPLWVTEYAEPLPAVSAQRQARDLARALQLASAVHRVKMFVWLMLRNHAGNPWQSGIDGRPAFGAFSSAAARLDPRDPRLPVAVGKRSYVFLLPALEIRWHIPAWEIVGVSYRVTTCGSMVARADESSRMRPSGWVPVAVQFRAAPATDYTVDVQIEDVHGNVVSRSVELVPAAGGARPCAL